MAEEDANLVTPSGILEAFDMRLDACSPGVASGYEQLAVELSEGMRLRSWFEQAVGQLVPCPDLHDAPCYNCILQAVLAEMGDAIKGIKSC